MKDWGGTESRRMSVLLINHNDFSILEHYWSENFLSCLLGFSWMSDHARALPFKKCSCLFLYK